VSSAADTKPSREVASMPIECSPENSDFETAKGRRIIAAFDAGRQPPSIIDSSTGATRVDCPIIKVRNDTGLNGAIVRVVDQHPNLNVTCSVCTSGSAGTVGVGEIVACSDAFRFQRDYPGTGAAIADLSAPGRPPP
jgi:hypothetical protein